MTRRGAIELPASGPCVGRWAEHDQLALPLEAPEPQFSTRVENQPIAELLDDWREAARDLMEQAAELRRRAGK
jgi:hypothetical protein